MQLWIVGIICLAAVQIHLPAAGASPVEYAPGQDAGGLSAFGSTDRRPNAKFGERIKDWYRRLKNRILGRKNEPTTPSPYDTTRKVLEDLNITNEDVREAQRHPESFYLDLSRVRFDPSKDWGFRLGKWYFIRKLSSDSMESNGQKSTERTYPEWPTPVGRTIIGAVDWSSSTEMQATEVPRFQNKSIFTTPEIATNEVITKIATTEGVTSNDATTKLVTTEDITTKVVTIEDVTTKVVTIEDVTTTIPTTKVVDPVDVTTKSPDENVTHKKRDQSAEVMGPDD